MKKKSQSKTFICSAYPPYLAAMVGLAVVLTTGAIFLYMMDRGEKNFAIQFFSPFMLVAALWCLIETAIALFSGVRVIDGTVIISKTVGQGRQEFPLEAVRELFCSDKARTRTETFPIKSGYLTFRTERGVTYAAQFPHLSEERFSKIRQTLTSLGFRERTEEKEEG